ncbi:MAG: hypothetical protein Kow0077_26060 [Anaerolineae bacterium]
MSHDLAARLHTAAPAIPEAVWASYAARWPEEAPRLAAHPAYLRLLDQVYRIRRAGEGILELLDVLLMAFDLFGGDDRTAISAWQEAISGELRVVDTGLRWRARPVTITLPPVRWSGLQGRLCIGTGGGRPGRQFDNWSTWSVRAVLEAACGDSRGDPPRRGGWGDRAGWAPIFRQGGGDNQINHFALALRLYAVHRLPGNLLVGPIPPQDRLDSADGALTTVAWWFLHGGPDFPARDFAALRHVLRNGHPALRA